MNEQIKPVPGGRSLLKAILQAVAILAITAGLSQAILFPRIQGVLLDPVQRWEVEYLNGGTVELLAQHLNSVSASERPVRLNELSSHFGFNILLQDLHAVDLDSDSLARLRNFETVGNPSSYSVFKLLDNADQVLVFADTKVPADHLIGEAQRRSMGTLAMLESELQGKPQDVWAATIEDASETFGYPVSLVPLSGLDLSTGQLAELHSGRIVTIATEDSFAADYPAEMVYKKVGDNALALGPFSPPTLKRFYPVISTYYIFLGLVVMLPLGLWLAPTWRSMNQLSRATTAFGHGDFTVRAAPIRGSKTNHLIEVFNQMAIKIQGLVESNKALINAVSHELRTPISRIEFNIELARQSTDIAERNGQLDRIEGSVDELKTMVAEMLQYARFDREKPNFMMESVDIGEWLSSELDSWRGGDNNVKIQINVPEDSFQVSLERYYMSRAISNLVRNAVRYASSTVVVSAELSDGSCQVSVSDDGPGVDYQDRIRIFEPFVRQGQSRSRDSGGTGLGLAIVKQILAWHAGDVWVDDSVLGGANFVIQWPQAEEA